MASHKVCGPKGVGVLFVKNEDSIESTILGGNQEFGLRAGTENFMLIAAFSEASENAAISIKFSVPALNPNSWFPPKIVDSIESSFLTKSTPTPFGPQTLCEAKKNA